MANSAKVSPQSMTEHGCNALVHICVRPLASNLDSNVLHEIIPSEERIPIEHAEETGAQALSGLYVMRVLRV
jgi:hypothetical protein